MYGCLSVLHYNPYFRCLQPVYYAHKPSTMISLKLHSNGSRLKRVLNSFLKAANRSLLFLPLFPILLLLSLYFSFFHSFSLFFSFSLTHSVAFTISLLVSFPLSLSLFYVNFSSSRYSIFFFSLSFSNCLSLFYFSALASRFFLNFLPHRRVIFSR